MPDILSSTTFMPHLNQQFQVAPGPWDTTSIAAGPRTLELITVQELGAESASNPEQRRPFSLIFRDSGRNPGLPQTTYTLEHAALGALAIFLVPIGPDEHGLRYEAVFT